MGVDIISMRRDMQLRIGRRLAVNGTILSQGRGIPWNVPCMFQTQMEYRI